MSGKYPRYVPLFFWRTLLNSGTSTPLALLQRLRIGGVSLEERFIKQRFSSQQLKGKALDVSNLDGSVLL